MLKYDLTYSNNSATLFERIRHLDWAVWLDSGKPAGKYGRYDIMVATPFIKLTTVGSSTKVERAGCLETSLDDPFLLLNDLLRQYKTEPNTSPFVGGALGYFAYDLGRRVENIPVIATRTLDVPEMMIGFYDWAVVVDHQLQASYLVSALLHHETKQQWQMLCDLLSSTPANESIGLNQEITNQDLAVSDCAQKLSFKLDSDLQSNFTEASYSQAFNAIKRYILEGDCYQVNLAQRFSASASGDAWAAYKMLREISPAPFMSFMNYPGLQVLSGSPERFIQVKNKLVETRPIKGTRPRSEDPVQDAQNASDLQNSLKDRAENVMIVDLLRNDIGKNCEIGTVKASDLFKLQSFANVHHLVSIVTGKLAKDKTAIDVLRGSFPGGSITGAPKLRAMQIIEELEPNCRNIYCGSIGYISFDGQMDTNIAIRTAVYSQNRVEFQAGGGIVADSELNKEYAETLDKAASLIKTMQHFRGSD